MGYIYFKLLLSFIIIGSCYLYVENMEIKNYEKRDLMRKFSEYLDNENKKNK